MSFENCNCGKNEYQHETAFEELFAETCKVLQGAEDSPLTDILKILDLTWDDLSALQAQQIIAIFHGTITQVTALTRKNNGNPRSVLEAAKNMELANMLYAKAETLGKLRAVLDTEVA